MKRFTLNSLVMVKLKKNINPRIPQALATLGMEVRHERKSRRLNQQQLADLAGVGINFVGQVEAGKPTAQIGLVIALLQVLGIQLKLTRGKGGLSLE